jgi:hypothetical protein
LSALQGPFVELHALRHAVAFELALDPQEDLGVDRLRAGIAAPQPPGHRGEQEQRVGEMISSAGQVDEVLRVQHQAEDVEAPPPGRTARPGGRSTAARAAVEQELREPTPAPSASLANSR